MVSLPNTFQFWSRISTGLVVVCVLAAYHFGFFNTIEASLTDRFFTTEKPNPNIVIVTIDEVSLDEVGQWPFSRSTHGALLEKIDTASVVAFDVIFSEPSRLGGADDEALRDAIVAHPGVVVLPVVLDEQSGLLTKPLPLLAAVSETGFVNTKTDRDGVVRRMDLLRAGEKSFDAVIGELLGATSYPDTFLTKYHGPARTYTTLSYSDVLNGSIPKELFTDTVVLVGASAAGLGDNLQTPFGVMSGVEIHANSIDSLLERSWLQPVSPWAGYGLLLLVAALTYVLVVRFEKGWQLVGLGAVLFFGIIIDAYIAFSFGYVLPHVYQLVLFVLLMGVLLLLKYLFEQKEKAFIRKGFTQYVASEVVEELANDPSKLSLGGETKTLSILFSDIRGFTTISEQLTPQELMEQLNEYLEEMSEAIMNHGGLVDKYIGDAVMAFWGAPLADELQAVHACESVVAMMQALEQLNERWKHEGRPPFAIGVGISTGDVVVGNMGSRRRFNYSIIGDEVNFSARIEGLTKAYGVQCLIGERTYRLIEDAAHLVTRELDDVMVKGKLEPRRIYELLTTPMTDGLRAALEHFASGRVAYLAGDFVQAKKAFEEALAVQPDDGPSRVFLERCEALILDPPTDWNGVFAFKTK